MALTLKLTPGYIYTDNEVDTAAKRNLLGNPTVALEGSIGTLAIADGAVTTPKLVDGILSADAVGRAKMADGFLSADAAGRGKMADGFVTAAKAEETFREGVAQFGASVWSTGGGFDTYTLTLSPAATAYTAGMRVVFKAATANGLPVKLNVSGIGAINLFSVGTIPLVAGQIMVNQLVEAIYDGTNFQLVSGVPLFITGPTAIATGLMINVTHGLTMLPRRCHWVLRCVTTDALTGFTAGDEVDLKNFGFSSTGTEFQAFQEGANATNVWLNCISALFSVGNKSTQVETNISAGAGNLAKWNAVGYISP